MALTQLGSTPVHTNGDLPAIGSTAPDFTLAGNDLKEVGLKAFAGKNVVLNIFQVSIPAFAPLPSGSSISAQPP